MFQWVDANGVMNVRDEVSASNGGGNSLMLEMMQPRIDEEAPITASLATATMAPFTTELDDLFISVKTTKHYHHSRLMAIIGTWFQFAKDQVSFLLLLLT